jgi:hypothetical protein
LIFLPRLISREVAFCKIILVLLSLVLQFFGETLLQDILL